MYRLESRTTQRLIDFAVLSFAYWLAFLARFDGDIPYFFLKRSGFLWPYVVGFQYLVLVAFGVPRFSWRYIGLRETNRILGAFGVAAGALLAVRLIVGAFFSFQTIAGYLFIPIGVIAINFMIGFLSITGVRVLRRLVAERVPKRLQQRPVETKNTLLIGAGEAGVVVAKEIQKRPDMGIQPVGFVDDNVVKIGSEVHGLRVLGDTSKLAKLAEKHEVEQAIITIANAPGLQIRRIAKLCEAAELPVKIIPAIHEIIDGKVNLQTLRDVSIEDLLRRDVIQLDPEYVHDFLQGKTVLVTGAGGSIGAEICRQVARIGPKKLLLVERSEAALFPIHRELANTFPKTECPPVLCDVGDRARLEQLFRGHRPDVIFHAAAHKHVPMVEWNPGEAIRNNVFGTRAIAELANEMGVGAFVLISTDKAVNPTSVMGATKRVAETVVQALSQRSETKFMAVRFGNVLGSQGSVIPIFRQQIAAGGPVTVTHPDMVRYFMTIPEATQLVLQAGAIGKSGEIFVLDMGEPVKIVDLATDLIRLSGLVPDEDITIEFTGVRPGEKLFEELSFDPEKMERTRHPKIFVGKLVPQDAAEIDRTLATLHGIAATDDAEQVRRALKQVVPEMTDP